MVAPINATAQIDAGGEPITLRLNFATLDAARKAGADLLSGQDLHPLEVVKAVQTLSSQDHPEMDEDMAMAIVFGHGEEVGEALAELFESFGGVDEGNAAAPKKRSPKKQASS